MFGVGLMVRVVGLGSWDPEFKSASADELIPGGVDSVCHPSEVGKMSASLLVSSGGVATVQCCAQSPRRLLMQHRRSATRVWSQWMGGW